MRSLTETSLPLVLSSFLLLSIGILVIFSSSTELAVQQLTFAACGAVIFFIVSRLDYRVFNNLTLPLYFLVLFLLLIVLLLDIQTRGSVRWIPIGGVNIQPSELAKPALILALARFWSKKLPSWRNILISLFWTLPFAFLVFKQPDLGSAITLIAIWFGVLVASKVSLKKLIFLILFFVLIIPAGWLTLHDYQRQRVVSFLVPENDPLGRGYNLIQSTIAVGSGQIMGRGLGRGTQSRLQFLPEFRTDFIFASIAEEMGFIGSLLIIFLYIFLIFEIVRISRLANDYFGYLIVFGVASMVFFQTFVNIGMNVGIMPITGITLPLLSYGGSSMITTLMSLGMVGSVYRFRKRIDSDSY